MFNGDGTILARRQRPGRRHRQRARPDTRPERSGNQAVNKWQVWEPQLRVLALAGKQAIDCPCLSGRQGQGAA